MNRHAKVVMRIVDKTEVPPKLEKDAFWDVKEPRPLDMIATKNLDVGTIQLITSQEKYDPRS